MSGWCFNIQNFEKQLDTEHEAAMGFAGTHSGVLRIEGIGYFDPDIVTFYGSDPAGVKTQLVQHVTQLNVILRALPKGVRSSRATAHRFSPCCRSGTGLNARLRRR